MSDRPIKIILDTNVWISFLIGQKASAVIRKLLTSSLLELAHVSNADLLVTGDKDLTEMHQFGKCTIMTIEELEKRL